jgi:hypothetical protein
MASPTPIIKKGCGAGAAPITSVGKLILLDGGSPGILLMGKGVGVAQLPGVTPKVGANRAARSL